MSCILKCVVLIAYLAVANCSVANSVVSLTSLTTTTNPQTISCGIDSLSSNDSITWIYTDPSGENFALNDTTLSLNLTSISNSGEYVCSQNGNPVTSITASYIANPSIQNTRHSVTFNDGDTERKLSCISAGSYPTVQFEWRRRGETKGEAAVILSPSTDSNININSTAEKSTILFHNLTYDMQAYYECHVSSVGGNGTVEVLVRVKDRLAALWPFLGIVAEVALLITIIFLYERQSKKTATQPDDESKDEDEKPLKADNENGSELRNRAPNNNYK